MDSERSQSAETKSIAYGILSFLDEEFRKPTTSTDSRESLEVAIQCLETAFGVSLRDRESQRPTKSLRELFRAATPGPSPTHRSNGPDFSAFSGRTGSGLNMGNSGTGTTGTSGGDNGSNIPNAIPIPLGDPYLKPAAATEVQKLKADDLKETGNRLMKDGEFSAALEIYNRAVELDGNNAVYFCNRSAAYLKLGDLQNALRDVQIALQLLPDYARAYGRMGVIYSTMGKNLEAYSCYKRAVELEPSNESYVNNLRVAHEFFENQGSNRNADPLSSITQMFQNPALMSMASQMLQDPQMQTMMRTIVQGLQTGSATVGDGGFDQLLQMGQAIAQQLGEVNPELTEQLSNLRNSNNGSRGGSDPANQNDSYDL